MKHYAMFYIIQILQYPKTVIQELQQVQLFYIIQILQYPKTDNHCLELN